MEKTKYYYNGKLVRTSANGTYRYAVIDKRTNECKGCRSDYKAADAIITKRINALDEVLQNMKRARNAAENGRTRYGCKSGRHTYYADVTDTAEGYAAQIESQMDYIEETKANWQIVELEAK